MRSYSWLNRLQNVVLGRTCRPAKRRNSTRSSRSTIESLEVRSLPAAAVTATFTSGVLRIEGTAENDTINVRQSNQQISIDGVVIQVGRQRLGAINASQVSRIEVNGGDGNDFVMLAKGRDRLPIAIAATLSGGRGNDTLLGGSGNDSLDGNDGNDSLVGNNGNDLFSGGLGSDNLEGGNGNDILRGGQDNDMLFGGSGNDDLYGGAGNDRVDAGDDNDHVFGDLGNDSIVGGGGSDTLMGNEGDDFIQGGDATDVVVGGLGNDTLDGGAGADRVACEDMNSTNVNPRDFVIRAADGDEVLGQMSVANTSGGLGLVDAGNLRFVAHYDGSGWTKDWKDAVDFALRQWASRLKASYVGETIDVSLVFGNPGANVAKINGEEILKTLARASSTSTAVINNVSYPIALAQHIQGHDTNSGTTSIAQGQANIPDSAVPETIEMKVTVNTGYLLPGIAGLSQKIDWYLGTDGKPAANQRDFVSVLMHEIGHGLGFTGGAIQRVSVPEVERTWYGEVISYSERTQVTVPVYEKYTQWGLTNGRPVQDLSNADFDRAMTSNDLWWNGTHGVAGNAGMLPKLYAPSKLEDGSTLIHLDEGRHGDEMMSPNYSGVDQTPSVMELGMLEDMGWNIATPAPAKLTPDGRYDGPGFSQSATAAERFQRFGQWSDRTGGGFALPNFEQADFGQGTVFGTTRLKPNATNFRDIPASELGNPTTTEARFRAIHRWADNHGYVSGVPTFQQANFGGGTVYGAYLLKPGTAIVRDISASELGNPANMEDRFRAINRWASDHGYAAGFPNFEQADYGQGTVYGAVLVRAGNADHVDVPEFVVAGRVTLRTDNGHYLCAEDGGKNGREVTARPLNPAEWETFEVIPMGGNKIALKSAYGQYVNADGGGGKMIHAFQGNPTDTAIFEMIGRGNGRIALRTSDGQHYLCAEDGGGRELNATRTTPPGAWETFTFNRV